LALTLKHFKVGETVRAVGFLAARSAKSKQPVLHMTEIELLEGN
jgi:primosomal replication protein N